MFLRIRDKAARIGGNINQSEEEGAAERHKKKLLGKSTWSSWTPRLGTLRHTPCLDYPSVTWGKSRKLFLTEMDPRHVIKMSLEMGKAQIWAGTLKTFIKLLVWTWKGRRGQLTKRFWGVMEHEQATRVKSTHKQSENRRSRLLIIWVISLICNFRFRLWFLTTWPSYVQLVTRCSIHEMHLAKYSLFNWSGVICPLKE